MNLNLDRSAWKSVAFGDVIENVTDRVDNPSAAGVDRYVGLEHLDPSVLTVKRWDAPDKVEAQKLRFRPGDVIFGRRRAYQKKVAMAEFEGICSAHALVLRARPGYVHPLFLPVFLASDYFLDRAIAISVGSLSPTVNWRDLKVQEFELPPLDEQKAIADLLWAVERDRQAANCMVEAVDRAVEELVDALLTASGSPERRIADVLELCQYGLSVRAGEEGAYPMLRMTNLCAGEVVARELKYCDLESSDLVAYRVAKGDVLFNRTNSVEHVGRSGIFNLDGDFVFASYLVRLRVDLRFLIPEFLNYFINSRLGQGRIRVHISKGVQQANINAAKLKTVSIPVPTLAEQRMVVNRIGALDAPRNAATRRVRAIGVLHAALSREVFGGEG
ncbi:restriction endonuclease subunit S [Micromonospora carbonacea]|uniref:restriction endonuclease subunit S n=1 Tax=Micromonospora carbonacea TaxID=47853 RepID=UPI00332B7DF6